jgi:hypothetical protein
VSRLGPRTTDLPARAHNPKVAGSDPAPATNRTAGQARSQRPGHLLSGASSAAAASIAHLCHTSPYPHRTGRLILDGHDGPINGLAHRSERCHACCTWDRRGTGSELHETKIVPARITPSATSSTEDTCTGSGKSCIGRSLGPPQALEATGERGEPLRLLTASARPDRPTATERPKGERLLAETPISHAPASRSSVPQLRTWASSTT